jgi:hypothetical protein
VIALPPPKTGAIIAGTKGLFDMTRTWLLALPFAFALSTPAFALSCQDNTDSGIHIGLNGHVSGGFHFGEPYTEDELNTFDQMELKRQGIDATRVERWNGCLRAWVRSDGGGEEQQFFDPNSYERLDLTYRP